MSGFDAARLERIRTHFDRYVDDGRLPGYLVQIARDGELAYEASGGRRDVEADLPVEPDTLWRIYSMTKPITSVAAMMLWEEGALRAQGPDRALPARVRRAARVRGRRDGEGRTAPAAEPIRMWHLLTHTSGLTYGFHHHGAVDELYRAAGFEWGTPPGLDLAGCCRAWAELPLLFQPGTEWNYGHSTDVLGRVVEVISGQPLDEFLAARVLGRSAWRRPASTRRRPTTAASPRSTSRIPRPAAPPAARAWRGRACTPPRTSRAAAGSSRPRRDYARFTRMLRAAASSTACACSARARCG